MIIKGFLLLLAASPLVSGSLTQTLSSTTTTARVCETRKSTKSQNGAIPTTTRKTTLRPNIIVVGSKSTPIKTVTPRVSTTTVISTASTTTIVTDSTVTDVFSTTSTIFTTVTLPAPTTTILSIFRTDSTTTSTTTSLIPTPAGFRSVQDTTGTQNYGANSNPPKVRREERNRSGGSLLDPRGAPARGLMCDASKTLYPVAVTCTDRVQVRYTEKIILVAPTSTTTLQASTTTTFSTTTSTSTSTVVPARVSTTSSFSTTSTIITNLPPFLTTSVSTLVSTVTATATVTNYAICQSGTPNQLGPRIQSGNYLGGISFDRGVNNLAVYDAIGEYNDPVSCCNRCNSMPGCLFSLYATQTKECAFINSSDGTCDATQPHSAAIHTTGNDRGFNSIVSNGACGGVTILDSGLA